MTRAGALEALIAAVEAGTICSGEVLSKAEADLIDAALPLSGNMGAGEYVSLVMNGSIDAALGLHEALLPGWKWALRSWGGATVWAGVRNVQSAESTFPARAWLLAILRAVQAKGAV